MIVSRGFCALVRQWTAAAAAAEAAAEAAGEAARGPPWSAAAHAGRQGQRGLPRRRVLVGGGRQLAAVNDEHFIIDFIQINVYYTGPGKKVCISC